MSKNNKWALITGASSGLGIDFAKQLAAKGYNLVLTARSEQALTDLATTINQDYGVKTICEPLDLSEVNSPQNLLDRLDKHKIQIDTLINNAGFGLTGSILDYDPARLRAMLQLNVISLTELCQLFGQRMAKAPNGNGGNILLVASMASYMPIPLFAAYAASKAYIVSLGEALNVELASQNVNVTVLSPGLMNTGFNKASDYVTTDDMQSMVLPASKVAQIGLKALFNKKSGIIAGRKNALMVFITRFVSRHALAKQLYKQESAK